MTCSYTNHAHRVALSAIAIATAALAVAPAAQAQPTVEPSDACFFDDPEDGPSLATECGSVVLPKNPDRPDSPDIRLGYMRLPARSDTSAAPLFMLAGGLGQSLIAPDTLLLFGDAFLGPVRVEQP